MKRTWKHLRTLVTGPEFETRDLWDRLVAEIIGGGGGQRYKPVEHIENATSAGASAAYIDTGIVLNSDDDVEIIFQSSASTGASPWLFGNRKTVSKGYALNLQPSLVVATYGANSTINGVSIKDQVKHTVTVNGGIWSADGIQFYDGSDKTFTGDGDCLLFGMTDTDGSIEPRAFAGKIFRFKVWRGGALFRNFIPAKDTIANVYGMYETIEGKFYGSAGKGAFSGGAIIERVEYIANPDGEAYILTPHKASSNTRIEVEYEATDDSSRQRIFGNVVGSNKCVLIECKGTTRFSNKSASAPYNTLGKKYNATNDKISYVVNGETVATWVSPEEFSSSSSIYMFRSYAAESLPFTGKIFRAASLESETKITDYIPVKVGEEYAMLDLVSWTVYRNDGTGAFTGGDVVPWDWMNAA